MNGVKGLRIVFMGTPEFAVPSLDMLLENGYNVVAVVTQPDKPNGRGNKLTAPPVKERAVSHGIMVLQPEKVRTPQYADQLRELNADLFVTAAYGRILTGEVLSIPPLGCINVHGSLLPKYRGAAPANWAIINGESVTGITTMYTDIGMDTGDMLLKSEIQITDDMTAGQLLSKLSVLGAEVLKQTLDKLKEGTLISIPQKNDEATDAPIIRKELGLIDWNKSAKDIHNLVRGINPKPGAFTYLKGERLRVWSTEVVDDVNVSYNFGTVCKVNKEGIVVAAGDGFVKVMEVQPDSRKKMAIDEYLAGHKVCEGDTIG